MARRVSFIWIVVLAVMSVIFVLSSQSYEEQSIKEQLTRAVDTIPLGEYLSGVTIRYGTLKIDGQTDGPGGVLEFMIRKLAHFLEYFLLSLCLLRAIRYTAKVRLFYAAFLSVAVSAGFAVTDELHQLFAENRGPRAQDVYVDTAGSIAAVLVYAALSKRKRRKAFMS